MRSRLGVGPPLPHPARGRPAPDPAAPLPRGAVDVVATPDPGPVLLRSWDELVGRTPGTDVTQLSAWSRVRRLAGFAPIHLLARRDGELVGGAQILVRRLPLLGGVGYLPYGPIIAPGVADRPEIRRALAAALARLGRRRLRILFVQPPEGAEDVSADLLELGFRPSTAGIAPPGSLHVDLTEDLATIRGRFGKRLKSWTNRWESRGVSVRPGDERDLPLLHELMTRSAEQQGHPVLPYRYVEALYQELAPTHHAAIFVGEVHGAPVVADLVTQCAGMVRGRLGGFDRSGDASRLSVPAAVRWQIIQWGKARGYRWLDFGGLRPATLDALLGGDGPPADGWAGADQPKLTFGGTAFRYPQAVEMIRPAALRAGYDLAWRSERGRLLLDSARTLLRGGRPEGGRGPAAGGGDHT